ncbi:neo-calmodulin-like [Saccostrea echinata]|uniref:neo-calmodulin-like n=1 Tax=Saccostrea echinata TaxID=191078 RepID=UPI002A8014A2|nr:neo-calmodulin-like [Saccostrea echinata]
MARRTSQITPHETVVIPNDLTDKQFEEIKESFNKIDLNGDGRLSKRELMKAAAILGMNPTEKDVNNMMKDVDKDGDGFISFKEYLNIMRENYKEVDLERERMKAAFSYIDKDNDGYVTLKELKVVLCHKNQDITTEEIEEFFKEIDADGDGKIDYEEFIESDLCNAVF